MTDVREFIRELAAENAEFWRDRDVRLDPQAPPAVRLEQIRYRMRQGVYNELRSVELLAAWIPYTGEREMCELLAGQLADEHPHWQLLRNRLTDLGEDPDAYRALPEWEQLFDWPVTSTPRRPTSMRAPSCPTSTATPPSAAARSRCSPTRRTRSVSQVMRVGK